MVDYLLGYIYIYIYTPLIASIHPLLEGGSIGIIIHNTHTRMAPRVKKASAVTEEEEVDRTIDAQPASEEVDQQTETEPAAAAEEGEAEQEEQEQEEQEEQEQEASEPIDNADDEDLDDELSDVDEDAIEAPDLDDDVARLTKHKRTRDDDEEEASSNTYKSKKKKRSKGSSNTDDNDNIDSNELGQDNIEEEDDDTRRKRLFEEKFAAILKKPTSKRRGKNGDVDLEAMQDEAITHLKNMMKDAAYLDTECVNNKKPATHKLKLLPQVRDTLLKSNLYDSILDNNLLEAVRIWLEPLPDGSLPAFEIQRTLFSELSKLPIKTIHLRESGLGKIMVFYQNCKKVDPILKRSAEKLIGDWTRPILGRSDNYRAKKVQGVSFDYNKYEKDLRLSKGNKSNGKEEGGRKSLYEESADRRKRAAAPAARTSVYTIAPQVNTTTLYNNVSIAQPSITKDERFRKINQKLNLLSQKKKTVKKGGVSIEGRGLTM